MFLPLITFDSIHEILRTLFDKMLPICGGMIHVASGVAGIGALLYISYRVWQSIARAEPLDVFPLLRPFAIGICILFFDTLVVGGINGILSPVVTTSHKLLLGQTFDMNKYQQEKTDLERQTASDILGELYSTEDSEEFRQKLEQMELSQLDVLTIQNMYDESSEWSLHGLFVKLLRWLLEMVFQFASLVIDTIRTFYLVVLAILGPLAFAISVFDGFQASLTQWIAKYVSVYLWLPIADIFGSVLAHLQVLTLQKDMEMLATDPTYTFCADNGVYLVFLFIGICGYFTIPSIASWIVQASGFGNYNRVVSRVGYSVVNYAAGVAGAAVGNVLGHSGKLLSSKEKTSK